MAGVAVEVADPEEKRCHATGSEPSEGFHAFRLDLREAVLTSVEGDELVVRLWRPGRSVETFGRR